MGTNLIHRTEQVLEESMRGKLLFDDSGPCFSARTIQETAASCRVQHGGSLVLLLMTSGNGTSSTDCLCLRCMRAQRSRFCSAGYLHFGK